MAINYIDIALIGIGVIVLLFVIALALGWTDLFGIQLPQVQLFSQGQTVWLEAIAFIFLLVALLYFISNPGELRQWFNSLVATYSKLS